MAISASHFSAVTNGFEQKTSGLWVHLGSVSIKGPSPAVRSGGAPPLTVLSDAVPRIHQTGWADGHIRLDQRTPSEPRIGFHESDSSALALYKQAGSNSVLRVRGNDNVDYPLAGAPGSGQAYHGVYRAIVGWTVPSINVWHETPVQKAATISGGLIRLEASGTLISAGTTHHMYIGMGVDGSATLDSLQAFSLGPSVIMGYCVIGYVQPAAGAHRFSLFIYATALGGLWGGAYQNLWVTEQKI